MSKTGRDILRGPGPTFASIHPSAWKVNSAKFAGTEFYEVREVGILRSSGHHIDIRRTGVPWCRDPGPGKVG
jgi:hypothetical protein